MSYKSKLEKKQKIDALTLLEHDLKFDKRNKPYIIWKCKCDCGKDITINEKTLLNLSHYHSCGCYERKYLTAGDVKRTRKAGKARADKRNVDGVNVDMLFRNKTISTNTSGTQGVSWSKTAHKWHVYIGYQNRRATLGYYEDLNEAKKLREKGLQAVKENRFEEFFYEVRGKEYKEYKKQAK